MEMLNTVFANDLLCFTALGPVKNGLPPALAARK
jgi:hypothetical protein